jgi:hypothetical protein
MFVLNFDLDKTKKQSINDNNEKQMKLLLLNLLIVHQFKTWRKYLKTMYEYVLWRLKY